MISGPLIPQPGPNPSLPALALSLAGGAQVFDLKSASAAAQMLAMGSAKEAGGDTDAPDIPAQVTAKATFSSALALSQQRLSRPMQPPPESAVLLVGPENPAPAQAQSMALPSDEQPGVIPLPDEAMPHHAPPSFAKTGRVLPDEGLLLPRPFLSQSAPDGSVPFETLHAQTQRNALAPQLPAKADGPELQNTSAPDVSLIPQADAVGRIATEATSEEPTPTRPPPALGLRGEAVAVIQNQIPPPEATRLSEGVPVETVETVQPEPALAAGAEAALNLAAVSNPARRRDAGDRDLAPESPRPAALTEQPASLAAIDSVRSQSAGQASGTSPTPEAETSNQLSQSPIRQPAQPAQPAQPPSEPLAQAPAIQAPQSLSASPVPAAERSATPVLGALTGQVKPQPGRQPPTIRPASSQTDRLAPDTPLPDAPKVPLTVGAGQADGRIEASAEHSAPSPAPSPAPASATAPAPATAPSPLSAAAMPAMGVAAPIGGPAPAAAPAPALAAPMAASPSLDQVIEQVADLREACRALRPELTLRHSEFGAVSMRLEPSLATGDWKATLFARDPGFVPAVQTALADRAMAAQAENSSAQNSSSQRGQDNNSQAGSNPSSQNSQSGFGGTLSGEDPRYGSSTGSGQGPAQPYMGEEGDGGSDRAATDQANASETAATDARSGGVFA